MSHATSNLQKIKIRIETLPWGLGTRLAKPLYRATLRASHQALVWLYTPIAVSFWLAGIRVPDFLFKHIGHLMLEPDCYLKEQLLQHRKLRPTWMVPVRGQPANQAAMRYWSTYFTVINDPFWIKLLRPLAYHPLTRYQTSRYTTATPTAADCYPIGTAWGTRPPLLSITAADEDRGRSALVRFGLTDIDWYVCVHNRESGHANQDPAKEEHLHSHRNMPVNAFVLAIEYIVSQGGTCFRMGDPTMRPAPQIPGLIDYARSPHRADWLDLYLSANCRFFLGSNSGAMLMATTFCRPVAAVNMSPLTSIPCGIHDLYTPALYRRASSGHLMTFAEIVDSPTANIRTTVDFAAYDIELVANTPEDIRDLATEQLQRVLGRYVHEEANEKRQDRFQSLFKPGHHCYGGSARIGDAFLERYEALLN